MGTILLLETDPDVREVLRELFERNGDRVVEVDNCAEAVGLSRSTRLDLAVVDVGPEDSGLATIVALHEDQRVPTIALYGSRPAAGTDLADLARQVGAERTFKKPFDFTAFLEAASEIRASPASPASTDLRSGREPRHVPRKRLDS